MRALFLKDADWLLFFLVGGLVTITSLAFDVGYARIFVLPDDHLYRNLYWVWWLFGLAFGLVAAVREELTGTEDYLYHRPVSGLQIFGVKVTACLLVLLAWLVLPLLLVAIIPVDNRLRLPPADWSRLFQLMGQGCLVLSSFAVGFFAGSLRGGWILRLLLGAALGFLVIGPAEFGLLGPDEFFPPKALSFAVLHVFLAAVLLWVAYQNLKAGRDLDLPWAAPALHGSSLVCGLGILATLGLGPGRLQHKLHGILVKGYPRVVETTAGEYKLYVWDRVRRRVYVDKEHRRSTEVTDVKRALDRTQLPWNLGRDWGPRNQGLWDRWHSRNVQLRIRERGGYSIHVSMHEPEGYVRLYLLPDWNSEVDATTFTLGRGPKGNPFSPEAMPPPFLWRRPGDRHLLVGDPADGKVWSCDLTAEVPVFKEVPLPQGDHFVAWDRGLHNWRGNEIEVQGVRYRPTDSGGLLAAVGEKDLYIWKQNGFEVASPEIKASRQSSKKEQLIQATVTERDPLHPRLEVRDAEGTLLLEHRYGLYTFSEKLIGGKLLVLSLLRCSLLQVASYFHRPPELPGSYRDATFLDPLLVGGKRPWLLACCLLLCLGLAWHAYRRLQRFGAARSRGLYWAVCIVLGGVWVYLLYGIIETRRSYRTSPILRREDAPSMLIRSA